MLTLLIATAFSIKFSGGTPSEFAASLATATGQNVIVQQSEGQVVPSCEYDMADLNEFARAIRRQTQMAIMPGADLVLTDGVLPRWRVGIPPQTPPGKRSVDRYPRLQLTRVTLPASAIKDGKITFKTEKGEALDLKTLPTLFSKPINMHWILKESLLTCQVKDFPEVDFLKWTARALGGRLTSNAKEYIMDIDPQEIRRRAVAAIAAQKFEVEPEDVKSVERRRNFRINCLNALTFDQIRQAVASEGSELRMELNRQHPLVRVAEQYYEEIAAEAARNEPAQRANEAIEQGGRQQQQDRSKFMIVTQVHFSDMLSMVDREKPVLLIVNSQFDVRVGLPLKGGGYAYT